MTAPKLDLEREARELWAWCWARALNLYTTRTEMLRVTDCTGDCPAEHHIGELIRRVQEATRAELREATIYLMGGPGWRTQYECGHGVSVSKPCEEADCGLNVVRRALGREE